MSNTTKITFNKSNTNYANASQLASNLQKNPETVINQYYDRNTNPSAGLEYVSNQVISGQPSQFVPASPPPLYEYRASDPRVSANAYSNQRNAAAPAAVAQTSTLVKEPRINEEIQRPQYSSIAHNSQPSKKLGPDQDPKTVESPLCKPWCWVLGVLLGLALLTLALLFGLGVIGGSRSNSASTTSPAVAVAPSASTSAAASASTSTTAPTAATTTGGKVASIAPTPVAPLSTSTNTAATTPTGTTSVSPIPYVPSGSNTATTTPSTTTTAPTVHPASIAPITVAPVVVKPVTVTPSTSGSYA